MNISPALVTEVVKSMAPEVRAAARPPQRAADDEDAWFEYVACVLSSRVRQEVAIAFTDALRTRALYPRDTMSSDSFARGISDTLRGSAHVAGHERRYPFPRVRGASLASAACLLYARGGCLIDRATALGSVAAQRAWLANNVPGIGPKQASMWLRNALGVADVAVIDTHLLRYGDLVGLWSSADARPSSLRWYDSAEGMIRCHASELGLSLFDFDITTWIVMRAYSTVSRAA